MFTVEFPKLVPDLFIPPWLAIAYREMGVSEIPGKSHTQRIIEYHQTTTLKAQDDETPWCSSFVNWCIIKANITGTNKAYARSWLLWGSKLTNPPFGAITVLSRGNNPMSGHVGFLVGLTNSTIKLLGGNQGDKVSISQFPKDRILSYRWA